ncbi:MAG TPA: hypothetical protein VIV12_08285 [Streptosporangiaceae bacterium]
MAGEAERLAEQVAPGEAALTGRLPRQLVYGDFWDDNVFFQGETSVFVADFAFMACPAGSRRRPRPVLVLRRHRAGLGLKPRPSGVPGRHDRKVP